MVVYLKALSSKLLSDLTVVQSLSTESSDLVDRAADVTSEVKCCCSSHTFTFRKKSGISPDLVSTYYCLMT